MGASDQFLRIGNIGRRDLVHHFGGRVTQHTLGTDVENLDDALRIGGDAREVGAVENGALQCPRLEQCLFRLLARGVVGANEQIADDSVVGIAQRRHRHHRRKPAAILADIGQLVDVLDPARGLEHQRLEARRDRRSKFGAESMGARDQFLRIGNIGRRDLVHHFGGRVPQHTLGTDVENLDDALRIGGDAREVGAVENCALQCPRLEQRLFRLLAHAVVGAFGDGGPGPDLVVFICHGCCHRCLVHVPIVRESISQSRGMQGSLSDKYELIDEPPAEIAVGRRFGKDLAGDHGLIFDWSGNRAGPWCDSRHHPQGLLLARLGHEMTGRACLLCPGISDINLLGYGECIVNLDAEVAHRALDFGVSQEQLDRA